MAHKQNVIVIRRSCLTGYAVWLYRGSSRDASRVAYLYARKKEVERVLTWNERAMRRKSNILRLLNKCLETIPLDTVLTPEQNAAARMLRKISESDYLPDMAFYEHIQESDRRRNERSQNTARARIKKGNEYYV